MNASLFIEYINKYFKQVVGKVTTLINDKNSEDALLHKTMLTEEFSNNLTWASTTVSSSIVAADVVSLGSSLPLKQRDKITTAQGRIPKIGIAYQKDEALITEINSMKSKGVAEATIANTILNDVPKVIKAIDVRKEIMFQQALSTGATIINDEGMQGTGIRVDFGVKEENTFTATTAAWGEATATPLTDIRQLFNKAEADGATLSVVMLSEAYFNRLRNSEEAKLLVASYRGVSVSNASKLPAPTKSVLAEALADEFGAEFIVVKGSFRQEKADGTYTTIRPWEQGNVVGLIDKNVGRLVYSTLAEESIPAAGVTYQKSGSHILVSKYSETNPLKEYTCGQALVLPVIDGANFIYILKADQTA